MNTPAESLSAPAKITTLENFEAWVAQDWIYIRGSDAAQEHVRRKLDEETKELVEALQSTDREEIVSELGDFLWTSAANGLNAGITCTDALRHELRSDQIGEEAISLNRIDDLALQLMPDLPLNEMVGWVNYLGHYLGKAAKQWRNLNPLINIEAQPNNFSEAWIQLKRQRAYDGLTQSVLISSALAQRHVGVGISEVIAKNVNKLQARKLAGLPITSLRSDIV